MKRSISSAIMFCAVAIAACDTGGPTDIPAPQFSKSASGPSSNGHMEMFFRNGALLEKYSYTAVTRPNGTVTGQFQVRNTFTTGEPTLLIHGETICITIVPGTDGRVARMGGIITHVEGTTFVLPGQAAIWTVEDNGEGANDPPDFASDISFGRPTAQALAHCAAGTYPPFREQLNANIQVKP